MDWHNILVDGRIFRVRFDAIGRREVQEHILPDRRHPYWRTINPRHYRSRALSRRILEAVPSKKALIAKSGADNWLVSLALIEPTP